MLVDRRPVTRRHCGNGPAHLVAVSFISYICYRIKVALRFSGVNFVSLNFIDYVSMALCMGDNRVGDTSDLLDLPQEMGLARRGSF